MIQKKPQNTYYCIPGRISHQKIRGTTRFKAAFGLLLYLTRTNVYSYFPIGIFQTNEFLSHGISVRRTEYVFEAPPFRIPASKCSRSFPTIKPLSVGDGFFLSVFKKGESCSSLLMIMIKDCLSCYHNRERIAR